MQSKYAKHSRASRRVCGVGRRLSLILLSGVAALLLISAAARAAAVTNAGTDFWLAAPLNYDGGAQDTLFITGQTATTGTVSVPGESFSKNYSVTPGKVTSVDLPSGTEPAGSDTVSNLGIHVTAGASVSVYGISNEEYTSDAYLGLPDSVLGTSYTVLAWDSGEATEMDVVGTEDGTTVTIDPTAQAGSHPAGTPYTVTLDQGDVYQVTDGNDGDDYTGTKITSDKPINVFGGNQCGDVPSESYGACDFLVQDLPPESAWGTSFLTVPLATRSGGDTIHLVADTDNTVVSINGTAVATLNAGQSYTDVGLSAQSVITSTKPILVGQFANGEDYDNTTGDPLFMMIPPTAQFLNQYTISTPLNADPTDPTVTFSSYVNLVVPTAGDGDVVLDGSSVPASDFSAIGSTGYSGAQVPVSVGTHTLSDGGNPFGVYTYGFAEYNGYGYPGGLALGQVATVSSITLSPPTQTDSVNTQACVTATVKNSDGTAAEGVNVGFSVSGANTAAGEVATDNSGQAQFCYTGTNSGNDTVTGSVGLSLTATAKVTYTGGGGDTTPPSCTITGHGAGPPQTESVTVQDTGSGLAKIYKVKVRNGSVSVPSFTPGTTNPVVVTATKKNQHKKTVWSFYARDEAGNVRYCH